MGSSCSHPMDHPLVDSWAHLASTEEVRNAVRGIEAWHKAQESNKATGGIQHAGAAGSLLNRMGGTDVVKRVVELFYHKLYADEKLLVYLHDKEMPYLRAKQSAFMSWLFGPAHQPYTGKHLRTAHLRLIKQRGFSAANFERGMGYFEEAMRELGAPESLIGEVMAKIRPFKEVIFTPSPKDADEEARWDAEERIKELQGQQPTPRQPIISAAAAADGAPAADPSRGGSRPASARGPQCPFTGGRLSRPASAAAPAAPAASSSPPPQAVATTLFTRPSSSAASAPGRASPMPPPAPIVPPLPLRQMSRPTTSTPVASPAALRDASAAVNTQNPDPPAAASAPPPLPLETLSAAIPTAATLSPRPALPASGAAASPAAGPSPPSSSHGAGSSRPLSAVSSFAAAEAAALDTKPPAADAPADLEAASVPALESVLADASEAPAAAEGEDAGAETPEGDPAGPAKDGAEEKADTAEGAGAEVEAALADGGGDAEEEDIVNAFMFEVAAEEARAVQP